MSGSTNNLANFGSFVPTSYIWDIQQLQQLDIDPQLKGLLVRLYQNINNIALVLNTKDTGIYPLEELLNNQQYFPNPLLDSTTPQSPTMRQVFRKVINFGTLPNTGSTSVAHGIDIQSEFSLTRIYGAATNTARTSFIPLPFASPTLAENIKLEMTNTNIIITTGSDRTSYTICYVIIELIKQ